MDSAENRIHAGSSTGQLPFVVNVYSQEEFNPQQGRIPCSVSKRKPHVPQCTRKRNQTYVTAQLENESLHKK